MSKLEELIEQYCPDGVEWKKYYDVCDLIRGITYNKNQEAKTEKEDAYKVLRANNITLYLNTLNFDDVKLVSKDVVVKPEQHLYAGDILMCAGSGSKEHVGKVAYIFQNMDYTFGGFMAVVRCKEDVIPRYMFHILASHYFASHLETQINSSTINNINRQVMQSFVFPVPPLPVQEEIVRILDAFTELQAELQAELQKRLQQYNYYRDNLLTNFTPEQAPKEYTLGDVTVDIYSGATPSKEKREYWINGTIPWMSSGEVNLGQVYEVEGRITQLGYDKCSTKMVPEGSVVIALAGQGKTRGTVAILRTSVCTNQSLAALVPQKEIVSGEYLYYYLKTQYAKLREVSAGDGTRGGLNLKMLRAYKVVIPSHKAQDQIVSILDRFDSLTNDLTSGLPAEIEKRRQQYEYYRDKLLTFKRKEA